MPRDSRVRLRIALLLATSALVAVACGGGETAPSAGAPVPSTGTAGPPPAEGGGEAAAPAPPTPSPTTPEAPPEPEWVAPVLPTKSPACATPETSAGAGAGTAFTTPGGRTFHVWGPAAYDPSKTYPVVLTYHGLGASGPAFESWFKMEDYVDGEAFVVYPSSVGTLWDVYGTSEVTFFDEMVKALGETYCIDPSRVFVFGFSYGGKLAAQLACRRAGYVKAVSIGDGSWGSPDLKGCGRLPVLVTHRTHDDDELISWGRAAEQTWAKVDKCSLADGDVSDAAMGCVTRRSCKTPGAVTFCEDTWFDPTWPNEWNHTVREPYRSFTWKWFKAQP